MTPDTSQVSAMLTGDEIDRTDKKRKELKKVISRSTYVRTAIDFFNGQPVATRLYWINKVEEEREA